MLRVSSIIFRTHKENSEEKKRLSRGWGPLWGWGPCEGGAHWLGHPSFYGSLAAGEEGFLSPCFKPLVFNIRIVKKKCEFHSIVLLGFCCHWIPSFGNALSTLALCPSVQHLLTEPIKYWPDVKHWLTLPTRSVMNALHRDLNIAECRWHFDRWRHHPSLCITFSSRMSPSKRTHFQCSSWHG